ncbi:LOW QUALITY PROTEIN: proto-oncogene tyrosine-protein kinase ROS [Mantella aurantiaca]
MPEIYQCDLISCTAAYKIPLQDAFKPKKIAVDSYNGYALLRFLQIRDLFRFPCVAAWQRWAYSVSISFDKLGLQQVFTNTRMTVTNLNISTKYEIAVRASSSAGDSQWTNPVKGTTLDTVEEGSYILAVGTDGLWKQLFDKFGPVEVVSKNIRFEEDLDWHNSTLYWMNETGHVHMWNILRTSIKTFITEVVNVGWHLVTDVAVDSTNAFLYTTDFTVEIGRLNGQEHLIIQNVTLFSNTQKNSIDKSLQAIGDDSMNINTGWDGGIMHWVSAKLNRKLICLVCALHTNELPLWHLIKELDGKTLSNKWSDKIGNMLDTATEFEINPSFVRMSFPEPYVPLSDTVVKDLSKDQAYAGSTITSLTVDDYFIYWSAKDDEKMSIYGANKNYEIILLQIIPEPHVQVIAYSTSLQHFPDKGCLVLGSQTSISVILISTNTSLTIQLSPVNYELSCSLLRSSMPKYKVTSKKHNDDKYKEPVKSTDIISGSTLFHHSNILKLFGFCLFNEPQYIILELMDSGDLLCYLRGALNTLYEDPFLSSMDPLDISLNFSRGCAYLERLHFLIIDCLLDLDSRKFSVKDYNNSRTVIIGDFGLAKDVYKSDYYRKKGEGLLSVLWKAPESLIDGIFTNRSDVCMGIAALAIVFTLTFQIHCSLRCTRPKQKMMGLAGIVNPGFEDTNVSILGSYSEDAGSVTHTETRNVAGLNYLMVTT